MHKIINSLGTVAYKNELQSIEICFKHEGYPELYEETMDIALKLAVINKVNNWTLIKNSFADLNTDSFLMLVMNYLRAQQSVLSSERIEAPCRINIVTKKQAFEKIKFKAHLLSKSMREVAFNINVFFDEFQMYKTMTVKDLELEKA